MQSYAKLNADHFESLFKYLLLEQKGIKQLIATLPLAGVCRKWRQVILPIVYKTLYLDNVSDPDWYSWSESKSNRCGKTNLDLIISSNSSNLVTGWAVRVHDFATFRNFIVKNNVLKRKDISWANVRSIALSIKDVKVNAKVTSKFLALVNDFKMRIPNVEMLELEHNDKDGFELFNRLASLYANHLFRLNIQSEFSIDEGISLANICVLSVTPNNGSRNLFACIDMQKIRKLTIYKISSSFKWNILTPTLEKGSSFEFSNLQFLQLLSPDVHMPMLHIPDVDENGKAMLTYKYPVLKTLIIANNAGLLENYSISHVFPENMECVKLFDSIDLAEWFNCQNIKHVKYLHFKYTSGPCNRIWENDSFEYSSAVDHMLADSLKFDSVCASINIPNQLIKQGNLGWDNLHYLELCRVIGFSKLVTLIKIIPSLQSLHATHVVYHCHPQLAVYSREDIPKRRIKPISSALRTLRIVDMTENRSLDYNIRCLDKLMLRLLHLGVFISDAETIERLGEHSEVFKSKYQHLESIKLLCKISL